MEPQETPNTAGSLDPQGVNLAKAIRQTESGGNFQSKGKSGEYGAYQWTQPSWQSMSSSAGVNVPLDKATPEQQNEVAYKQIEKWKQEGHDPGQIASMWNAGQGEPDAYLGEFSNGHPSKGVNSMGVSYDVPQYVDKVTSTYQQLKGQTPQQNTPSNAQPVSPPQQKSGQPGWLSALEGVGAAGLGWLAGNIKPLAGAGLAIGGEAAGVALGGPVGAVVGGTLGGTVASDLGLKADQPAPSGSSEQPSPQQEPSSPELGSSIPASAAATESIKNAIDDSLGSTQSNRVFQQSEQGKNAVNTAAQFGLISADEEGNMVGNEQKRQSLLGEVGNLQDKIIGANGGTASPVTVANYAGSFIGGDRINTASDREKAAEIVQKELQADAHGIPMNGQMSLSDMREAQKTHYRAAQASYTNPKPNAEMLAHKALGNAYGNAIRDKMADKELFDKTKKMESNLINAKQVLKRLHGKKAPHNKGAWESFLKQGARAAEIYIGDRIGGPVGAIIGGLAGEHLNHKIERKFGRNIFETKGMRAAMDILQDAKPKEYSELVDALKKAGVDFTETDTVPKTEKGVVGDVKNDLNKIGLVSLKKS